MRKCKLCKSNIDHLKSNAKFCGKTCQKTWWRKFVEPRAICEDCGTLMGIQSASNSKRRKIALCQSCSARRAKGTGKDF